MGKYIQYFIITYFGKESEKEYTHTHITELFCYTLETILINIFQFLKILERNKNITKTTKIIIFSPIRSDQSLSHVRLFVAP